VTNPKPRLGSKPRRAKHWLEGTPAQAVTFVLILATIIATTVIQVEAARREHCTERWADAFTARTQIVTGASQTRSDALDKLLLAAGGQDQAAKIAAYQEYLAASRRYKQVLGDHPLPEPPKLRC
jgi:hypothetical protein